MDEREYQEQLQAAAELIIKAAQGIDAYKTVTDKVIELVSRRPDAVIPEAEYQKIRETVSAEITKTIANYCCPLKVSEQRDIHPQCCCNGIADDFSEGKPLS